MATTLISINAPSMDMHNVPHLILCHFQVVVEQSDAPVSKNVLCIIVVNNSTFCDDNNLAPPATPCTEGSTRLADGDIEQEGRVEVCFGGVWGSICRYSWGAGDRYVACKSVGYDAAVGR